MQRRLEGSYQGSPVEGKRYGRIENSKGLYPNERKVVPKNASRNFIEMCGARGGPEKAREGAQ